MHTHGSSSEPISAGTRISPKRALPDLVRFQGYRCYDCDVILFHPDLPETQDVPDARMATVDHVTPQCVGGTNTVGNYEAVCASCNSKRFHAWKKANPGWQEQRVDNRKRRKQQSKPPIDYSDMRQFAPLSIRFGDGHSGLNPSIFTSWKPDLHTKILYALLYAAAQRGEIPTPSDLDWATQGDVNFLRDIGALVEAGVVAFNGTNRVTLL